VFRRYENAARITANFGESAVGGLGFGSYDLAVTRILLELALVIAGAATGNPLLICAALLWIGTRRFTYS
jgi:hypothetical protein